MPAYNAKAHIEEAVESILQQTCGDFELLVLDDGSTDDTRTIVQRFRDPRIVIAENAQNLGVVATLTRGLALSRGNFIARMDSDDISVPDRLAKQLNYLEGHPEVDIVGGAIQYFGDIERPHTVVFPTEHEEIRVALLFYCPLAHPAVMFRRSLIARKLLRYSEEFRHAEDYYLWSEMLQQSRAGNLTDVLLRYRLHPKQVRTAQSDPQYEASVRVRKSLLTRGGVNWTDADIELHESIVGYQLDRTTAYVDRVALWFEKIEQSNQASGFWESNALHRLLTGKFVEVANRLGLGRRSELRSECGQQYLRDGNYRPESRARRLYRRAKNLLRDAVRR